MPLGNLMLALIKNHIVGFVMELLLRGKMVAYRYHTIRNLSLLFFRIPCPYLSEDVQRNHLQRLQHPLFLKLNRRILADCKKHARELVLHVWLLHLLNWMHCYSKSQCSYSSVASSPLTYHLSTSNILLPLIVRITNLEYWRQHRLY